MPLHMKMSCNPVLKKLEGDQYINHITPVIDAQFLIGKAWDASLRLSSPEVCERHCTIEKVESGKWTVVSHENALVHINGEVLPRGLPKLLKFDDLLRITSAISFRFKCSCMDCDDLNEPDDIPVAKRPKISNIMYGQAPQQIIGEERLQSGFPVDMNLRSRCEQLYSENIALTGRLKKAQNIAMFWENEKNKDKAWYYNIIQSYNDVVEKYTQLCRLKEESDRNQNCDLKLLRDTVSHQAANIERLQLQLNQLQQDYCNVENFKINLENQNKQLETDNVDLHTKVEIYSEFAKTLLRKNSNLQTEVNDLKKQKEKLQEELETKNKESVSHTTVSTSEDNSNNSKPSSAVSSVQDNLTELLETEFKCSICDEVFIEAVVTNCTHIFCNYCIKSWKRIKANCPICRSILTKEVRVLAIDSFLTNVMSLATENLRSSWLKVVEERKNQKDTVAVNPASTPGPAFMEYPPPSSSGNIGFHSALMNVYRHLMHYEDVIDLTSDRTYGL